jgi:hypothetical protein
MGEYTNGQQMYQQYQQNTTHWAPVMTNREISSAMPPPANNQQSPYNQHTSAIQQQWHTQTNSYRQENPNQNSQRMTSTSEEEEDILCNDDNNTWQVVRGAKRRKTRRVQQITNDNTIEVSNAYESLPIDTTEGPSEEGVKTGWTPRPPPIFIHGVVNYTEMAKRIKDVAEDTQYHTKSLPKDVIKINCSTPDTYRKMVKYFKDNNIYHHTYQLKEDRAYRVVIKYLHFSTDSEDIKQELSNLGHKVRNIINARNRVTKEPLNLFFVDLEPAENNKDIYNIKAIQNRIIKIEPPRTNKNNQVQCMRCQQYGHTKRYCNMPYVCVKCSGNHSTASCTKSKDSPAKCALCGGNHPANYKGCEHYHSLIKPKNNQANSAPINSNARRFQPQHSTTTCQQKSYADIARMNTNQNEEVTGSITKILNEFKGLFNQLLQQNSMVLNMLTMLINKLK